jgi:hypothetical protein
MYPLCCYPVLSVRCNIDLIYFVAMLGTGVRCTAVLPNQTFSPSPGWNSGWCALYQKKNPNEVNTAANTGFAALRQPCHPTRPDRGGVTAVNRVYREIYGDQPDCYRAYGADGGREAAKRPATATMTTTAAMQ